MLPNNGRLGGSGTGQPSSKSPSMSQTAGQPGTKKNKSTKPHNLHGFDKRHAKGTLNDDLRMGRMGVSYMHNPAFRPGAEDQNNKPKQLPSQHIVTHGDDEHAIAHSHMDNARKAKTTDEKRKHTFSALSALNKAKKKGY